MNDWIRRHAWIVLAGVSITTGSSGSGGHGQSSGHQSGRNPELQICRDDAVVRMYTF